VRILHWIPVYRPYIGGMEVFLSRLVPALAEHGHEVRVITGHGYMDLPDHEVLDGVKVDRFRFTEALAEQNPGEILRISRAVDRISREFSPDIVHLHFADASSFFYPRLLDAHLAPAALTFHVHPPESTQGANGAVLACIRAVDRIAACSQVTLDAALAGAPEERAGASVLRCGLPVPPGEPAKPSFDPPVVATAGRIVDYKGFNVLIDATPALRDRLPGVRVVIAGDGPELPILRAQARELGVEDTVEFLGWVEPDGIHGLFESASVVAVPSLWQEPFGLVAVQAHFAARPVVATRVGGLPEAAGEEGTVLVEPGDAEGLAAAIAEVVSDPERARLMGEAGRAHAVREFAFERSVDDHLRFYEEMAA
jgi:glycogen synthase